jgi:hypothetical protein
MSYKLLKLLELLKLIHHSRIVEINQWWWPTCSLISFSSINIVKLLSLTVLSVSLIRICLRAFEATITTFEE